MFNPVQLNIWENTGCDVDRISLVSTRQDALFDALLTDTLIPHVSFVIRVITALSITWNL